MLLKSEIKTVQQLNIYQKLKRSTIYRGNYIWNSKFKPPNQWNEMWNWKLRVGSIKQPRNEHPLVGMFCSSLVPLTDPVIVTATKNHRAEPCHNPTTPYHTMYHNPTIPYHTTDCATLPTTPYHTPHIIPTHCATTLPHHTTLCNNHATTRGHIDGKLWHSPLW